MIQAFHIRNMHQSMVFVIMHPHKSDGMWLTQC